jgi:hypothetical protein
MSETCPLPPLSGQLPVPRSSEVVVQVSRLVRIFFRDGPYPSDWMEFRTDGPLASGRFDHHHPGVAAGVMYAARRGSPPAGLDAFACAVAETFQLSRVVDVTTRQPWVVWWTPTRPLRLLDLGSTWTTRAGGNQALCSGDRNVSRSWARAIHRAIGTWTGPDLDGLTWPSSVVGPGKSVVLTERAADAIPHRPDLIRPLADPGLGPAVRRAAARIGYLVV